MVEHMPGLVDLILFLANDVSVVHIFRYGLIRGTLSDKRGLALTLFIITGDLFKIILN
jgi:hypothetical protein